ncbi:MAG: hypothetical protein PHV13_03335, partial [Candidatus ainarchaeum sp.]|nr:hypothetical protein [Candidatus ainarchaeum sp.]
NESGGLLEAFEPYFEQRAKGLGQKLGAKKVNAFSAVFSFTPWIPTFQKGIHRSGSHISSAKSQVVNDKSDGNDGSVGFTYLGDFLASPSAQSIRQRNMYDEEMNQVYGTSAAELDAAGDPWGGGEFTNDKEGKTVYHTYNLGVSKYLILIKYTEAGKLGDCAIDENTLLPRMRTFGWCEPCTTSSLAFQNITANATAYLPNYTAKLKETGAPNAYLASNVQPICTSTISTPSGSTPVDSATCFNAYITDMQDYSGSPGVQGSPRTIPDATIIKERLGNYMKSGVLPVLDISHISNWNLTHSEKVGSSSTYTAMPDYTEYDFQRLFGSMGAAVVIVDHVSSRADLEATLAAANAKPAGATKLDRIIARSGIVRNKCPNCLTAVQVDTPRSVYCDARTETSTSTCFNNTVTALLRDPRAKFNIDMITFDYPVTLHPQSGAIGLKNKSGAVADDIAAYGRTALQAGGKPSMVVGFNVDTSDPDWSGNHEFLFNAIVQKQADLIGAGVIGIIYSPVRDTGFVTQGSVSPFTACSATTGCTDTGLFMCGTGPCTTNQGWWERNTPSTPPACTTTNGCSALNLYRCTTFCTSSQSAWEDECSRVQQYCAANPNGCIGTNGWVGQWSNNCARRASRGTTAGAGLVNDATGVGLKTEKFCAYQGAMERMSASAPVAVFRRIAAQDIACVACSSLDYTNGACNLASPTTQLECDDGGTCSVPTGMSSGEVKCPSDVVTTGCTLCTEKTGAYSCTYAYTNGTSETVAGSLSDLSSDLYSDIIAGLPKPDKCCIEVEGGGSMYSYAKQAYQSPINKPLVFAKTGDVGMDCGTGGTSSGDIEQVGNFCGYSLPLKQYDITCTVSG